MNNIELGIGGRAKIAGGSADIYYDAAQPTIDGTSQAALETYRNFAELRECPPDNLRAAFFPNTGHDLRQRLRGSGLYRFLRTDQGPGGNFTAFTHVTEMNSRQTEIELAHEIPHALLEESVRRQMSVHSGLGGLATQIGAAYADRDLKTTYELLKDFEMLASEEEVRLPEGAVGSRTGFFLIHPIEASRAELRVDVTSKIDEAFEAAARCATIAEKLILNGCSYHEAVYLVRSRGYPNSYENGALKTDIRSLSEFFYAQYDCLVDTDGNVEVERANFPDVGFFLQELDARGNRPLEQAQQVASKLLVQVQRAISEGLVGSKVTVVTKDETIKNNEDTLEVLEIQALKKMLADLMSEVEVCGVSDYAKRVGDNTGQNGVVLLLNPNPESTGYGAFTEQVIKNGTPVYPHPLLKTFEFEASTLPTIEISGKHLTQFLALVKPKKINASNAGKVQGELDNVLGRAKVSEDVMYFYVPGLNTPVPVFRHSLHSFMQIHNAVERMKQTGTPVNSLFMRAIPFSRDKAVFGNEDGKRLGAFRVMAIRK